MNRMRANTMLGQRLCSAIVPGLLLLLAPAGCPPMSDDNQNPLQRTLLMVFRYLP